MTFSDKDKIGKQSKTKVQTNRNRLIIAFKKQGDEKQNVQMASRLDGIFVLN